MARKDELATLVAAPAPQLQRGQPFTVGQPAATDTGHVPTLVSLDLLDDNPYQPRLAYDDAALADLAAAIRAEGLMQPPIARRVGDRYQLVFGHRRKRAYMLLAAEDPAAWGTMPLVVRDLDDEAMARQAWHENRDRKDLTSYEEAMAIQRYTAEFGWSQAQAAEKMQLDRSTIANKLRLLKLPQAALAQLRDGTLSERQAMALLPLAELPAEALASTERVWTGQRQLDIVSLFQSAGGLDSATLRSAVEQLLAKVTITLAKEAWTTVDTGATPVHAIVCKDCPIRLKASNRCPDRGCAGRKREGYAKAQAAAAAASLRLPPVARPADATPYQEWCDGLRDVQRSAIKEMAAERQCRNLGVVYETERTYTYGHKLEKHPNCYLVCAHGVGKRCACKAALARATDRPEVSAQAQARADKKRIKAELIGPAEAAIAQALATPTVGTWRELLSHIDGSIERKLPADAALPAVLAAVAAALVRQQIKYDYEYGTPSFLRSQEHLTGLLGKLGAPVPWVKEPPAPPAPPPADVCAQTPPPLDIPADSSAFVIHHQLLGFAAGEVVADADALQQLGELLEDLADQLDDATYEDLARRIDDALDQLPEESEE